MSATNSPALFYFWAHDVRDPETGTFVTNMAELHTPVMARLLPRVGVVFLEGVSPNMDGTAAIERDLNEWVRTGVLSEKLRACFELSTCDGAARFLGERMRGTGKCFQKERTLEATFDFPAEERALYNDAIHYPIGYALTKAQERLERIATYDDHREAGVAEQIVAIQEPTLVLFGSGHLPLEQRVRLHRPTEVHFPWEGYTPFFETQMTCAFRRTRTVDRELYLRSVMEMLAIAACRGIISDRRARDRVAHHYATLLTPDQITDYLEYVDRCERMSFSARDSFEVYLSRESLPSVEDVLREVR